MANTTKDLQINTMKTLTFGCEVELKGLDRERCARIIAAELGGTAHPVGGYYGKWMVRLADGREWTTMTDGSLGGLASEVVSPICKWEDLEDVQRVVRALRRAGGRVDSQCGLHVHVGAAPFDAAALGRLARWVYSQEAILVAGLDAASRVYQGRYCAPVDQAFINNLPRRPASRDSLAAAWYGGRESSYARSQHYHSSRYHGLNLHSVFFRGTVEFRYFAGTLHAGKVKASIQLCLAMAAKALTSRSAVTRRRDAATTSNGNLRYAMRVVMIRLGMIGPEFKTARLLFTRGLPGNGSTAGTGRTRAARPAATGEVAA